MRAVKPAKVPEASVVSFGPLNDLQKGGGGEEIRLSQGWICLYKLQDTHNWAMLLIKVASSLLMAATTSLMDLWKQPTTNTPVLCGLQTQSGEGREKASGH